MKASLILGPAFTTTYPEVVKLFQEKDIRGGYTTIYYYDDDQGNTIRVGECFWYTTMMTDRSKMERRLELTKSCKSQEYKVYDNYNAIEIKRIGDIPYDYDGPMGVPTSFFKYQNELEDYEVLEKRADLKINGKKLFQRLIIQKRK